jgi:hypothetical protein
VVRSSTSFDSKYARQASSYVLKNSDSVIG